MARKTVEQITSDLSGKVLKPAQAWVIEATPPDGRSNKVRLDVARDEIEELLSKGTEIKRRGRRPGSTNKPKS